MDIRSKLIGMKGSAAKYGKQFVGLVQKNSPTILSATAVVGFIGSMVLLWKTKDKIEDDLEERKEDIKDINEDFDDEEEVKEEIKEVNKRCVKNVVVHSLPVFAMSTVTIASIIASVKIGNRRFAAVSAAYTLLDQNSKEWREKARELLGESRIRKVDETIADEVVRNHIPTDDEIITTNKGNTLFYDSWSGRYFRSSIEFVRRIINDLNYRLISEDWLDLNEFYYGLGLEPIKMGEIVGWNISFHGQIPEPKFLPRIMERNGVEETVIILNYDCHLREQY